MKIKKLLSVSERQTNQCHFCGTNLSVKYVVEITSDSEPKEVCACNKCVLKRL